MRRGLPSPMMVFSSTTTLLTFSIVGRSNMRSSSTCSRMERRPRAPVFRARAFVAIACSACGRTSRSTPSMPKSFWYCLIRAFFGSVSIWIKACSSSSTSVATTGSRPTNSGISPYLMRSSGSTVRRISLMSLPFFRLLTSAPKPMPLFSERLRMIFSRPSNAPPQMNSMFVVSTCTKSWLGCLRRHRRDRPLDQLQQRLLHAFAGNVPGDRRVIGLARNLVDLVDIDDAALRLVDVVVAVLEQLLDDVLHVLADIARLGERCRVGNHERNVQEACHRLREQRLARSGGADEEDVRFGELDLVVLREVLQALVVVVYRDRKDLLGKFLPDHVLVQYPADFPGRRQVGFGGLAALVRGAFLADDVVAQLDALVADEHRRPGDQLPHLVLALAAEGAVEKLFAARFFGHCVSALKPPRRLPPPRPARSAPCRRARISRLLPQKGSCRGRCRARCAPRSGRCASP